MQPPIACTGWGSCVLRNRTHSANKGTEVTGSLASRAAAVSGSTDCSIKPQVQQWLLAARRLGLLVTTALGVALGIQAFGAAPAMAAGCPEGTDMLTSFSP